MFISYIWRVNTCALTYQNPTRPQSGRDYKKPLCEYGIYYLIIIMLALHFAHFPDVSMM